MDVEGVHLEEARLETSQGEDSELSLSFQGYVDELRQCQSKMRSAQIPQNGRNPSEGKDCQSEQYKATIVWRERPHPQTHYCTFGAWGTDVWDVKLWAACKDVTLSFWNKYGDKCSCGKNFINTHGSMNYCNLGILIVYFNHGGRLKDF